MLVDPRTDLATIWAALESVENDLLCANILQDETESRRKWDEICEAMARITEGLGFDPLDLN